MTGDLGSWGRECHLCSDRWLKVHIGADITQESSCLLLYTCDVLGVVWCCSVSALILSGEPALTQLAAAASVGLQGATTAVTVAYRMVGGLPGCDLVY